MRSLALAANASAMYLGMSLGAWSGARLYGLAGVETLIPASLLLTLLGVLALQRSRQAQRAEERLMRSGIGIGTGAGSVPKVWVQ